MMHIQSIGTKLTVWYTSLLTVTFLLLGGIAYGLLTYSLSRDIDSALNGVADVLVQRTQVNSSPLIPSDVDALFRRFLGFSPLEGQIDVYDSLGKRDPRRSGPQPSGLSVSPQAMANASNGIPTFETMPSTGSYPIRVLTKPVIESGHVTNLVQVGMPLENMLRTRRRFLFIMASVLPLGLLLAGGGGWLAARRALKSVDRMTRTARRISGERLNERVHETGSGDELDRLAKTLNEMLGRLDKTFLQMRQFSADASHELQTPLTILKGEMEVALRSSRSAEEYQRVLKSGLEEIDRINRLVAGLLLLARADAGALRLDVKSVSLNELLQEICDQMAAVAEAHTINLTLDPTRSIVIPGDREHLRRLMLNLVDNAIKYTRTGGKVTLSLASDDQWAWVRISDTGIGLSTEEQKRVFDRFHRATETRARDERGVGLGLSIAQSIAEAHQGRIEIESAPGQGSTFVVYLPILV